MSRKTISAETRKKISASIKKLHAGPFCPIGMYGRKHSEETKAKMSFSARGKKKSPEHVRKMAENSTGEKSGRWGGGQYLRYGYIYQWVGPRRYKAMHRIIAEKALGRELKPNECPHHINGNRSDNRNCNLLISTRSYHQGLHERMKKRAENLF